MGVVNVDSLSEFDGLLKSAGKKVVVVDFFATWCGPCRAVAPQIEALSNKYAKVAVFAKVDVDRARDVSQSMGIRAMPTFHVYSGGSLVEEVVGANVQKIISAIETYAPTVESFGGQGQRLGGGSSVTGSAQIGSARVGGAQIGSARVGSAQVESTKVGGAQSRPAKQKATESKTAAKGSVDESLLAQLLEMGFEPSKAERSLRATNSTSLAMAVDYLASGADDDADRAKGAPKVPASAPNAAASDTKATVSGKLRLRLPNGEKLEISVKGDDTIGTIRDAVSETDPIIAKTGFKLQQSYPRKEYTEADSTRLLGDENLLPRGQLQVVPM